MSDKWKDAVCSPIKIWPVNEHLPKKDISSSPEDTAENLQVLLKPMRERVAKVKAKTRTLPVHTNNRDLKT